MLHGTQRAAHYSPFTFLPCTAYFANFTFIMHFSQCRAHLMIHSSYCQILNSRDQRTHNATHNKPVSNHAVDRRLLCTTNALPTSFRYFEINSCTSHHTNNDINGALMYMHSSTNICQKPLKFGARSYFNLVCLSRTIVACFWDRTTHPKLFENHSNTSLSTWDLKTMGQKAPKMLAEASKRSQDGSKKISRLSHRLWRTSKIASTKLSRRPFSTPNQS